jgi:hypothetical protein
MKAVSSANERDIGAHDSADAYALSKMPSQLPEHVPEQAIGFIVISATRPVSSLRFGIELAKEAGVALVVLASHGLRADQVTAEIATAHIQGFALEVPDDYMFPLTADFATHTHAYTIGRTNNLSSKRNLGLALSHLTGQRVFFLDDDIRDISADKLAIVGSGLNHHAVSGFFISDFPDSAVSRHAYRLAGGSQAPDLTGNSLGVNPDLYASFFPNVYNEDLIFMYDALAAKSAVALSWAKQLPYNPFKPERAIAEEFGCILAVEGLLSLLAEGRSFTEANTSYWATALERRRQFLDDVTVALRAKRGQDDRIEPALIAIQAALAQLAAFKPTEFTTYVKYWRSDLKLWRQRLESLPNNLSLKEALHYCGFEIPVAR